MATDICIKIGRRIRVLLTQRGWTQAMLADHAELAREHLSGLENGHKEIGARSCSLFKNGIAVHLLRLRTVLIDASRDLLCPMCAQAS